MPDNYIAYHQPNKSGYISPRKLVKAQQKIAASKHGCKFINGHVETVEKDEEQKDIVKLHIKAYPKHPNQPTNDFLTLYHLLKITFYLPPSENHLPFSTGR